MEDVPEWAILWVLFKRLQTPSNRRPGPSIDHMVAGNAPWKGTSPPIQIRIEDPDTRTRRDDGTWRRRDKGGRFCPVTMHGERIAKPRGSIQGGRSSGASRPSSVSPHFWWKVPSAAQRMQRWKENKDNEAGLHAAFNLRTCDGADMMKTGTCGTS